MCSKEKDIGFKDLGLVVEEIHTEIVHSSFINFTVKTSYQAQKR